MVCDRCIKVVREELTKLGYTVDVVKLGEAKISSEKDINIEEISKKLEENGFELLGDKQSKIIVIINISLIVLIQIKPEMLEIISLSNFIADKFLIIDYN